MTTAKSITPKEKKSNSRAEYTSPAVDKAIDVIEFLASQGDSASITAIADGINRSVGEIYRVVLALEQRGIVRRDETTDRLRLSLRLFELAYRFPPVERLVQVAKTEMDTLTRKSKQSCHLAVAEEHDIKIVATKESPLPMHYSVRVGSSFEMFETSSGVVITAFMSQAQRDDRLMGIGSARREELLARFENVRQCGYEMHESETVSGLSNVSVPVKSQDGKILAALTVPYLKQREAILEPEAVLELQFKASRRMSKRLG